MIFEHLLCWLGLDEKTVRPTVTPYYDNSWLCLIAEHGRGTHSCGFWDFNVVSTPSEADTIRPSGDPGSDIIDIDKYRSDLNIVTFLHFCKSGHVFAPELLCRRSWIDGPLRNCLHVKPRSGSPLHLENLPLVRWRNLQWSYVLQIDQNCWLPERRTFSTILCGYQSLKTPARWGVVHQDFQNYILEKSHLAIVVRLRRLSYANVKARSAATKMCSAGNQQYSFWVT